MSGKTYEGFDPFLQILSSEGFPNPVIKKGCLSLRSDANNTRNNISLGQRNMANSVLVRTRNGDTVPKENVAVIAEVCVRS